MPGDLTDLGATMEIGMALVILSAHAAGAATPDQVVPAEDYVEALGRRGIAIRKRVVGS